MRGSLLCPLVSLPLLSVASAIDSLVCVQRGSMSELLFVIARIILTNLSHLIRFKFLPAHYLSFSTILRLETGYPD